MNCKECHCEIIGSTYEKNNGLCFPCLRETRYEKEYLGIDDFFKVSTHDYCLAPNLEPHPSNEEMIKTLTNIENKYSIKIIIPVKEYEDENLNTDPYSDRIFIASSLSEKIITNISNELNSEFYQEDWSGSELPRKYSNEVKSWCLVWD